MTTRIAPAWRSPVRRPPVRRPIGLAVAAAVAFAPFVHADVNRPNAFVGTSTGSLGDPTNWSLGVVPGAADDVTFPFAAAAGTRTLSAANLTVGSLNLLANPTAVTIANATATAAASTLTLGGPGNGGNGQSASPADLIYVPSTLASLTISSANANGGGTLNLSLGQSGQFNINSATGNPALNVTSALDLGPHTLTLAGTGMKSFSGGISGGGSIVVSGRGAAAIFGATPNTFSGGVTVETGATFRAQSATSLGTGTLTLNDGATLARTVSAAAISTGNAVLVNGNFAYAGEQSMDLGTGPMTLNANAQVSVALGTLTLSGPVGDGGHGYGLTKTGVNALVLKANATYVGGTTINAGSLTLTMAATGAAANNILPATGALTLGGGTLTVNGAASTTNGQAVASTTLAAGASSVTVGSGGGGTTNVALGNLAHQTGGTVNVTLPTSGTVTTTTANATSGILGPWATMGRSDWAVSTASGGSPGAISAFTGYTAASATPAANADAHVDVTAAVTTTGPIAPRTLRFNATTSYTLTLTGTNVVTAGGVLFGSNTAAANATLAGGTLTSGTGELIVSNFGIVNVNSNIADNNAAPLTLVHAGNGQTTFNGTLSHTGGTIIAGGSPVFAGNNTYTGRTTVLPNVSTATIANANAFGATGVGNETVISDHASVQANVSATINEAFVVAGAGRGSGAIRVGGSVSPTFAGNVQLAGDTLVAFNAATGTPNRTATFSGVISDLTPGAHRDLQFTRGNGAFGSALDQFVVTNANTYGGDTYVTDTFSGSTTPFALSVQGGDDRLPTTTVVTLGGPMPSIGGIAAGGVSAAGGGGRLMLGSGAVPVKQTIAGLVSGGTSSTFNAVLGGATSASTLTINNTSDHVYAGVIGNGGVAGVANGDGLAFAKIGVGKQTFAGVGTFAGGTTVRGGTLVVNGGTAGTSYGLGSGAVAVDTTGVLAGAGNLTSATTTVGGTTAATAGGTITAGTGATTRDLAGTLTTGNLALNGRLTAGATTYAGGTYAVKFANNTAGTVAASGTSLVGGTAGTWDALSVGVLDLSRLSAASPFTLSLLQVAGGTFDGTHARAFKIIGATSIVLAGTTAIAAEADVTNRFVLDTTALNVADYKFSVAADYVSGGSADLVLNFNPQATPEPGTMLLAGLGVVAALGTRRGRRSGRSAANCSDKILA